MVTVCVTFVREGRAVLLLKSWTTESYSVQIL